MANVPGISKVEWRKRLADLSPRVVKMAEQASAGIEARRLDDARRSLVAACAIAPAHPEILRLQGVLKHLEENYAEAVEMFRQALAAAPEDVLILNNLGSSLRASGEVDAAIEMFRRATSLDPGLSAAWFNLGKTLKSRAQPEHALPALERALQLTPGHVPARIVLGDSLKALGRIDEAAQAFRHALKLNPRNAQAWFSLANLKTVPLTAAEAGQLGQLLGEKSLSDDDRIRMGFSRAKALEDNHRYAESFAALVEANRCKRRQKPWHAADFSAKVDAILAACARPAPATAPATQGAEVIFIVSLPRSGSTLTEQILAAHPDIEGASELPDLPAIINEESERRGVDFPAWFNQATADDWERLGKEYLQRTERWREEHPRFTDKGLANWQSVAAALAMLPAAKVVVCRRDPLETCFSCFIQLFARGQRFSYDIEDVVAYWRDFDRLCRHWTSIYPNQVRDMVYESLLAEPEASTRALLDFCGLSFDPACLRFHEVRRKVRTASAAQVLQPLRRDTARSERYGPALDAFRKALA
ncbi:MAG: sulfotransferase [Dokdonella sp.]|uniref:sulfotransferase n=2 Tax=Dokdonella sp. TaxID=2291710 RepID=UPI002C05D874|nr:sulfotransferase [Xanthomonadales bacterium]MBK7211232.1 sulfotransferase [Xanthomonadales bacterium]MBL0221590.1 sulfotransferase [Xanthomonadales bacterium]HQV71815.1 sulfotransferase [Dokdonella sp.]HQW75543.1 sulfotransferase [Dokdonella sp.]